MAVLFVLTSAVCHAAAPSDGVAEPPTVYATWRTFTTADGLPHDHIRTIHVSGDEVWIGTDGGLALRKGDGFVSWTPADGLAHPAIAAIDRDPKTNDLWLGTWGGGLVRFTAGRFDTFNQLNSGLAGNLVFAVVVDDDRVWAATNAGVSSYDPVANEWGLYVERQVNAPEVVMISMSRTGNGIAAGAWCGGLWRFDKDRDQWTATTQVADHAMHTRLSLEGTDDTTTAISAVGQTLWWTTQTGLFRRVGERAWEGRAIPIRPASRRFVHGVASSSETEAWLCTDDGLHVLADWANDTWLSYHRRHDKPGGVVTLTRHGRVVGFTPLRTAIPDNQIRCTAFRGKEVWVGTVNGLALGTGLERWDSRLPSHADTKATAPSIHGAHANERAKPLLPTNDPKDAPSVGIGVLGPLKRTVALPGGGGLPGPEAGRADLVAFQLAVQEANRAGGYRGRVPFAPELGSHGYEAYAWGTPEDEYITFAYTRPMLGIVGYIGSEGRVATAVALRTEMPVLNVASTPPTVDELIVPWIFRCFGDEPQQQRALLDHVFDQLGHKRVAVLRTPGKLTDIHLDWWIGHAHDRGYPVAAEADYDSRLDVLDAALEALRRSRAEAVLTWCDLETSATVLRRMREAGMKQLFVCSDRAVSDDFIRLAGLGPEPVIAAYPVTDRARRTVFGTFTEKYVQQNSAGPVKRPPGPGAYLTYDATRHLLHAIDVAGPDRQAIRRTLVTMSRDPNGEAHFEQSHIQGTPMYATLQEGAWQFHFLPRPSSSASSSTPAKP